MKQIKDYIGKKVAIYCKSKEEWQKILDLNDFKGNNNYEKSSNKCLDLKKFGTYWGIWSKEELESDGYIIYNASEFLEEENESLVGRYLKALVDNAQYIVCKKGDYFLITSNGNITRVSDNYSGFGYCHDRIGITWELMPKGWSPEQENKPMFEIGKWYKFNNKWYAKMHSQSQCSESINCDGKYEKNITGIDLSGKNKNNELLTDLSEIQKFLPSNHPDKIQNNSNITENCEYKVGDYVITNGYDENYDGRVLKITRISQNTYCYFSVLDKKHYKDGNNFSKYHIKRKATLSDIPVDELSKEELLEVAKYFYKPGVKYKDADSVFEFEVSSLNWANCSKEDVIYGEDDKGCIFYEGRWAEIINSSIEQKEEKLYYNDSNETKEYSLPKNFLNIQAEYNPIFDNQEIEIGDEVSTPDGNGILIGITKSGLYLIRGAIKIHRGGGHDYIKGEKSDKEDSYFYALNDLKLIKKASKNNTSPIEKKLDNFSAKVEITDTSINLIPKRSNLVTLGKIQEETKIKINYSRTVKI